MMSPRNAASDRENLLKWLEDGQDPLTEEEKDVARRELSSAVTVSGQDDPALWQPPDDLPAWSHGPYLWLGDNVSASGYKIDDGPEAAQQAAGIIRAYYADALGREVSGRSPSLLRKHETEAKEFNAAAQRARDEGMTLGEWVLRAVQNELSAAPHRRSARKYP